MERVLNSCRHSIHLPQLFAQAVLLQSSCTTHAGRGRPEPDTLHRSQRFVEIWWMTPYISFFSIWIDPHSGNDYASVKE